MDVRVVLNIGENWPRLMYLKMIVLSVKKGVDVGTVRTKMAPMIIYVNIVGVVIAALLV